jgi:hypothetical protein
MLTASMLHSNEDLKNQLIFYYAARIQPWHIAARQAVEKFNQQNPDQKLKELECEKLWNLHFKSKNSKQKIELKIKQQQSIDAFRAKLEGPGLHKEHTSLTPETMHQAIYNMLINHVGKPK